ncbi:Exocyst complex component 1 [Bos mutus]|uniref:Exocyst complex component 1 n=1 Tax=Bos mutus TaxID=72004 RepID=L8IES9_9CETA|nr:Exocyst complex component 1 [Bos mutus]
MLESDGGAGAAAVFWLLPLLPLGRYRSEGSDRAECSQEPGSGQEREVEMTKNEEVKIIMVKHYRIGLDEKYEVTKKWSLNDLQMIDGKEADTDNPFFDLHFKKVYSLEAYSCASKYAFARTVNKLNHAYLKKDLQIVNFDSTYINDDSIWSSNNKDCLVLMRICFYAFNLVCLSLCPLPL